MSIKVGIQSGVRFTSVVKDDNGNVELHFAQGKEVDALEALMGGGDLSGPESAKVLVWALKDEAYSAKIEGKKLVEHINQYKAFFNEILLQFYPSTEISWKGMFEGVDITTSSDIEKLSTSDVAKVGNNITSYAVDKLKSVDLSKEFRVKFYRSAPTKNFVSLKPEMFMRLGGLKPDGFRNSWNVPFIESMDIPEAASKLAYDDFERGIRKNGTTGNDLSDSTPVKADAATTSNAPSDLPF